MARPTKQGLDYFPLDSQFLSDVKVRKIMRAQGTNAISVLISLLCNIYRDKGYYIKRDDEVSFLIADEIGVKEEYVNEIIDKAIQVGFFDESQYKKNKILTSNGIQKRFLEATERRKISVFNEKYRVNVSNNSINVSNNSINDDRSTQSKVKKSKVNENIVYDPPHKSFKQFTKSDFTNEIQTYLPEFGKIICNQFFSYWTEKSASGTMKFQLEKTWDTKRRLDTWRRNDEKFGGKQQNEVSVNKIKEKEL